MTKSAESSRMCTPEAVEPWNWLRTEPCPVWTNGLKTRVRCPPKSCPKLLKTKRKEGHDTTPVQSEPGVVEPTNCHDANKLFGVLKGKNQCCQ